MQARENIRETYRQLYKSLVDCLFSELSGDFRKAVILWTYDPPERDARLANEALKSKKKSIAQLQVIVDIACASSPHHLVAVRKAYCSLFDCSLEEGIISNVSLPLQKILVKLVSSYRYDEEVVDSSLVNKEAVKLREAIIEKKFDDDELLWILGTRNIFQLRLTFQQYEDNWGTSVGQTLVKNSNFAGHYDLWRGRCRVYFESGCLVHRLPEKHFAEVVRAAIIGEPQWRELKSI